MLGWRKRTTGAIEDLGAMQTLGNRLGFPQNKLNNSFGCRGINFQNKAEQSPAQQATVSRG